MSRSPEGAAEAGSGTGVVFDRRPSVWPPATVSQDNCLLVMGLDLATAAGYCYRYHRLSNGDPVGPIYLGTWDLSAGSFDSGAIRFARLRKLLCDLSPGLVGYEDAKAQLSDFKLSGPKGMVFGHILSGMRSSELFGAYKATLACWAEELNVPCQGFNVSTIKKRATGKGNASKETIIASASADLGVTLDPEASGVDNAADAFYIYTLVVEQVLPGLITPDPAV